MTKQTIIDPTDANYPASIPRTLGDQAPDRLFAFGNVVLLALPKTALFCSSRCPGKVILPTYDQAARWRDDERCVISGFHSPVEKECLQILLRGDSPVILCPARGMIERLPAQWAIAVAGGRMLILSCFPKTERRVTAELATRRNEFVAALADEIFIAHAVPGSKIDSLHQSAAALRKPILSPP
jgi:predicted Rossmann fold nucleotide-binding protein DprA/Smf involved in DNA uptake